MIRAVVLAFIALVVALRPAPAQRPLQQEIFRARDQVLPALVHIQPISEYYAGGKKQKTVAVGSGVIFTDQGHVVTNYHVVGRVKELLCTLSNRERVSADLVGVDPLTDIAVIQLATDARAHLPAPAKLGDSDRIEVGEYVMALGSPLALSRSLSLGVVSCVDRYFPDSMTLPTGETTGRFNTWIQTDAAINPGNSGGPLINLRGEVIGINARMAAFGENVGFAIPINVVRDVVRSLMERGSVSRSWIGVELQSLDDVRDHFQADLLGALVRSVVPGSPADVAGVLPGDLMVRYDGEPVSARFDEELPGILKRIADTRVGQSVTLTVKRLSENRTVDIDVTTEELGKVISEELECPAWGITVKELSRPVILALNLQVDSGVLVTSVAPGTELSDQLSAGDVIQQVNESTVETLEDFRALYLALLEQAPDSVLLHVRRQSAMRLALVKPSYGRTNLDDETEIP